MAKSTNDEKMSAIMLGDRLRECRESYIKPDKTKGLTQPELASMIPGRSETGTMAVNTVSRIENGITPMGEKQAKEFGKALGVRPEYLMGKDDIKTDVDIEINDALRYVFRQNDKTSALIYYLKAMGFNVSYHKDHEGFSGVTDQRGNIIIDFDDPDDPHNYDLFPLAEELFNFAKYRITDYLKLDEMADRAHTGSNKKEE